MKIQHLFFLCCACTAFNTLPSKALADDPDHPRVNEVNARERRQQRRIANGLKDDDLKPGQTSRIEKGEANLKGREAADEAKHDGHLTKGEQDRLNARENRLSRRIRRDKRKDEAGSGTKTAPTTGTTTTTTSTN